MIAQSWYLVNDKPMYALYIIYSLPSPVGPIDLTCTGKGDSSELVSSLVNDKPMYALYIISSLPSPVGPIDLTCTGKGDSSELVSSQ